MRKQVIQFIAVIAMGLALTACGAANTTDSHNASQAGAGTNANAGENANANATDATNGGNGAETGENEGSVEDVNEGAANEGAAAEAGSTQAIADAIVAKFQQPAQMKVEGEMVKELYHLDPALLEAYTILTPLMNVKTNELAVLKVKDAQDIAAVEEGIKQRAADVQKLFESYLQDQYDNAKNYKLVTKGNYVLFVIAEDAEKMAAEFDTLVK